MKGFPPSSFTSSWSSWPSFWRFLGSLASHHAILYLEVYFKASNPGKSREGRHGAIRQAKTPSQAGSRKAGQDGEADRSHGRGLGPGSAGGGGQGGGVAGEGGQGGGGEANDNDDGDILAYVCSSKTGACNAYRKRPLPPTNNVHKVLLHWFLASEKYNH